MEPKERLQSTNHSINFLNSYGTQKFITVFTRARHSVGQMHEVTTTHPVSLRPILIISPHQSLRFESGFRPFGFSTKIRQLQNFLFLSHDHIFQVQQNSFNA